MRTGIHAGRQTGRHTPIGHGGHTYIQKYIHTYSQTDIQTYIQPCIHKYRPRIKNITDRSHNTNHTNRIYSKAGRHTDRLTVIHTYIHTGREANIKPYIRAYRRTHTAIQTEHSRAYRTGSQAGRNTYTKQRQAVRH